MIPRAMGARKPGSQGERAISVKTVAQGRPDVSAYTCGSCPVLFLMHGEPRVRRAPGLPCALCSLEGGFLVKLGRVSAARKRHHVFPLSCPASSGASSIPETSVL